MDKQKRFETMLVLTTACIGAYFILDDVSIKSIVLQIGLAFGLIGAFVGSIANLITKGWLKLSEVMGSIMSKVILSIIFFVFLVPIAFLQKLFNKDNLQLKQPTSSVFTTRNHVYMKDDLKNIW